MSPLQFDTMCVELLGHHLTEVPEGEEGAHSRMIKLIEHFIDMSNLEQETGYTGHHSHKSHKSHKVSEGWSEATVKATCRLPT